MASSLDPRRNRLLASLPAAASGHSRVIRTGRRGDNRRCHRSAVRQLPLLASASAGVTSTTAGFFLLSMARSL